MEYLSNPLLTTIKADFKGNPFHKGKFIHPDYPFDPDFGKVLKWQTSKNPQRKEKKNDDWKLTVLESEYIFESKDDMIVWLGHATFFIRLNGVSMLTDPIFYGMPFVPRLSALPFQPSKIENLDYLLLSHGHFDHLDKKSLKLLYKKNQAEILTTLRLGNIVKKWLPKAQYQEAGWFQQYQLRDKGIEVFLLPARHWFKRGLTDTNTTLWGSFIIRSASKTIYFGADSGYGNHFIEIAKLFPEIDVCMLGVGAYKPSFMMSESHTSPDEAVQIFNEMSAVSIEFAPPNMPFPKIKTLIPMHYGTYDLADEPLGEPFRALKQLESSEKIQGKLAMLAVGEVFSL